MPTKALTTTSISWSARELRKLPPHERDRILKKAAKQADAIYRHDAKLTAFEAFGKDVGTP